MRLIVLPILVITFLISGCSGCSKSGRIKKKSTTGETNSIPESESQSGNKTRIKMEKKNGVYQIPVTINGSQMYFIFDTGAGMISISNIEATFLYRQGKLSESDILGKANFMDANGDISEGVVVRLREVTIGNRTLNNIEASVVDNAKAPLLFGQSALEKFGKISIDYERSEIVFE